MNPSPTRRDLDRLDESFDQFLLEVEFEFQETELTPEKRRARRKLADVDDLAFCRTYFPNIFTGPWNDLHRHVAGLKRGRHSISGFRKSGKSAFTHVAKAIKPIALGAGGIVCIANRTQDKAVARTQSLSRIIQRNRMLVYDYGIEPVQDAAGHHIFKSEGGQTHLVAGSVNVGLRSVVDDDFKRIRYAIADDLYDKETVRSESDNERVYDWITDELWGQLEDDALCITLGNSITADCPSVRLKEAYPAQHFSFPILDDEGRPTWPEVFPLDRVREMERETPYDVWTSQYMDRPALKGDVFDPDWIRHVAINVMEILATLTVVDPSYGQSPEACFKGIATGGLTKDHRAVLMDLYIRRESYPLVFDYLDALRERTPAHRAILFENDFSQWSFAQPYYLQWMERRRKTLPISLYSSKGLKTEHRAADKASRIMNLVHPHQTGLFWYLVALKGSKDFERYLQQYNAFGKSREKLDGLDAVATFYIMIWAYLGDQGFESSAKRTWNTDDVFSGGGWFH